MLNPVIDSALCSVAETSLNTLIKHDPHTASVLSGYTGRSVRVRSGPVAESSGNVFGSGNQAEPSE